MTRRRGRPAAGGVACTLVLAFTAGLSALSGCQAASGGRADPFAGYPKSEALGTIVRTHAEGARDEQGDYLLLTTWFLGGDPRVAVMCGVRPDGHVSNYRYLEGPALQPGRAVDLVPDQITQLDQAIGELPASQSPPLEHLLIVSSRAGGTWVTRTYDRTAAPPPVRRLFEITGARLDSQ